MRVAPAGGGTRPSATSMIRPPATMIVDGPARRPAGPVEQPAGVDVGDAGERRRAGLGGGGGRGSEDGEDGDGKAHAVPFTSPFPARREGPGVGASPSGHCRV